MVDNMDNLYVDLRLFKFLDIYSNVIKKNSFVICSINNEILNEDYCDLKNEFFIESLMMYINLNEEVNVKDELVLNYE